MYTFLFEHSLEYCKDASSDWNSQRWGWNEKRVSLPSARAGLESEQVTEDRGVCSRARAVSVRVCVGSARAHVQRPGMLDRPGPSSLPPCAPRPPSSSRPRCGFLPLLAWGWRVTAEVTVTEWSRQSALGRPSKGEAPGGGLCLCECVNVWVCVWVPLSCQLERQHWEQGDEVRRKGEVGRRRQNPSGRENERLKPPRVISCKIGSF